MTQIPSLEQSLKAHQVEVISQRGSSFSYSGGYTLLQLLLEEITGKSFQHFMQEEMLLPIGMHNSSFELPTNIENVVLLMVYLKNNFPTTYLLKKQQQAFIQLWKILQNLELHI